MSNPTDFALWLQRNDPKGYLWEALQSEGFRPSDTFWILLHANREHLGKCLQEHPNITRTMIDKLWRAIGVFLFCVTQN